VSAFELLCAAIMVVGLLGVVVQVLPGTLLVLGGIVLWATESQTAVGWVVLGVGVVAVAAAWVGKYLLAGRHLKRAEVPNRSLVVGGLAGVVGFFVIPVIGLPLLFVLGVFGSEMLRLRDRHRAWAATRAAIAATGLTILVELAGAMVAIGAWALAIALT
jgi:uncharacterized protein YqgC (DUF456 family)